jgi:hypothetical protein
MKIIQTIQKLKKIIMKKLNKINLKQIIQIQSMKTFNKITINLIIKKLKIYQNHIIKNSMNQNKKFKTSKKSSRINKIYKIMVKNKKL